MPFALLLPCTVGVGNRAKSEPSRGRHVVRVAVPATVRPSPFLAGAVASAGASAEAAFVVVPGSTSAVVAVVDVGNRCVIESSDGRTAAFGDGDWLFPDLDAAGVGSRYTTASSSIGLRLGFSSLRLTGSDAP